MTIMILDAVGYNWPTCVTCLVLGVLIIVGYRIRERRKGKTK